MAQLTKKESRARRHQRARVKINGTAARPRMSVCFSEKHVYVQFIDDAAGRTLVSVSTQEPGVRALNLRANLAGAVQVGQLAAKRAVESKIEAAVFDRGGFKYHGRVKAIADAAREAGLKI